MERRGFPQLTLRASQQPDTTVSHRRYREARSCGRIRPGRPGRFQRAEARQAKIARCDVLPTVSHRRSVAQASRLANPGRGATGRISTVRDRRCGKTTTPADQTARSRRRRRRVHATREASASCLASLGRPPPAPESSPSRRAAKRRRYEPTTMPLRPTARSRRRRRRVHAAQPRRGSTPRRAAAPPQHRCGHGRREGGRTPGWSHLAATTPGQGCRGHGWPGGREVVMARQP